MTPLTPQVIPFTGALPSSNVVPGATSLAIGSTGTYNVHYTIYATPSLGLDLSAEVRVNGITVAESVTTRTIAAGTEVAFTITTIVPLTTGEVVDLALTTPTASTVTLAPNVGAILSLEQLTG